MMLDRKPPYSMDAETGVIGAVLMDNFCINNLDFLSADDFYYHPNKEIFKLIKSEIDKGSVADLNLMSDLVTDDIGGFSYLIDIAKSVSSSVNVVNYARKVVSLAIRRNAIASMNEAIEALYDSRSDFVDEITKSSAVIDKDLSRMSIGEVLTIDQLIEHSVQEMEESQDSIRLGIQTGIPEIDSQLGYKGLAFGEITFYGAPSKNGKTLFANTTAARCDLLDDEVGHVFSIEMPSVGMFNGIVSAMSGVPSNFYARQSYYQKVFHSKYDEWFGKWGKAATELRDSEKITIDGKKDVTMAYIVAGMRKQAAIANAKGKKLRLVIIDHAHRISYDTSKKPMTYAMGDDARMLKNAADELGVAVLLLGQLNENSKDRNPTGFDILDTSRLRHEIQCFIGFKLFRQEGGTYFGVYSDAQRFGDHETKYHPHYVKLIGGVVKSLDDSEKHWTPNQSEDH